MDHATTNTTSQEETIDMLNAMLEQENSTYVTEAGLYDTHNAMFIDGNCRRSMIAWCMQVSDFCQFSRNTLCIAVNTLDRFVAAHKKKSCLDICGEEFQLAAMACLYTAVKTNENVALDPQSMSKLSKGKFSTTMIERMEFLILKTLQWRVNAPTALSFADLFLRIFPQQQLPSAKKEQERAILISQLVQDQIMYATHESQFLGVPASQLALAAVCNAVQLITGSLPSSLMVPTAGLGLGSKLLDHELLAQARLSYAAAATTTSCSIPEEEEATTSAAGHANSPSKNSTRRNNNQQQLSPRCIITMSQ
mmetsp:Transcript_2569/g.3784  ORF Transcript_2569/g.3784 Transcript_2569/m.3784 type:complete len:308 (+) Transcript_2569:59-982(+)|eukprot:CAMPEP_0194202632 /NCGR_PEP_ID=MMETSP0156-20130528/2612_1 /TAXON_ID=33649 /ORGANISM="Thalassionema nitzschioides, Strain L26-B" /LENGTH=307 /DNA_ID=CAMNT_0038928183 /DNA_START=33 /DNA_END=959 /DNA_ORIENTATION=-